MNFLRTISFTAFLISLFCNLSFSQSSPDEPFDVDTDKEILISATGAAIGVAAIIAMTNTNPLTLNEISLLNPQDVNAFDRIAIGQYQSDVYTNNS